MIKRITENNENDKSNKKYIESNERATNTTIGIIITNSDYNKTELCKLASNTRAAYSKRIRPCNLSLDGDTIYATSDKESKIKLDLDMMTLLSIKAMEEAIENAIKSSKITEEEYLSNINQVEYNDK